MEGIDVQAFISSQRAKLSREKEKLSEDRTPRGILPSGNQAISRAARLREERVSEYHDFLKDTGKGRASYYPTKSVAEIRRELAHDRHKELESRQSVSGPDDVHNKGNDYGSLKERRLAEERQYRGEVYTNPVASHTNRRRWDDVESYSSKTEFDNKVKNPPFLKTKAYTQRWENDEQELMKWARNQNRSNSRAHQNRAPTPPMYESPHKRVYHRDIDDSHKSMRSISAPVIVGGLPGLGSRDSSDPQAQRDKQRRYAEELRAQIQEKEEAKQRQQGRETLVKKPQTKQSPEQALFASSTDRDDNEDFKSYNRRENFQRPPRSPHRERQERFAPYPVPPHFSDHHGYAMPHSSYHPWMHPYYPPREMYGHHDQPSHSNPYYLQPHHFPMNNNPYLPPHGPPNREHDSDFRDSQRQRRLRYKDEVSYYRDPPSPQKENISPQSHEQGHEAKEHTSPLTGGSGKTFKQDKSSYRAELEKQMREKKERDLKSKFEKECYELKKEAEIYDPFGKGGCGAPVRDQHGNIVADLKQIHHLNEERLNATTTPSPGQTHARPSSTEPSPRTILNYEKLDEVTQKKSSQESYRDYLRQQVQEKEELKRKEKERKMIEEQREQERLEKERQKIQEDYQRDLKQQRMKEEEARLKNEEIKLEAERKRKEAARKIEEEQLREAEKERQIIEEGRRAMVHDERMDQPLSSMYQPRCSSPPIPTLRHKMNQFADPPHTPDQSTQNVYRSSSPPVPALQHKQQLPVTSSQTHHELTSTTQRPVVVPIRSSSPPVPTLRKKQQNNNEVHMTRHEHLSGEIHDTPDILETHSSSTTKSELQQNNRQVSVNSTRTQSRDSVQSGNVYRVDSNPQSRQPTSESDVLTQLAAIRLHLQSQYAKQQPSTGPRLPQPGSKVWQMKPTLPAPRVSRKPGIKAVSSALNEFTSSHPEGAKPPVSITQQERNRHIQSDGKLLSSDSLQFPLQSHPFKDGRPAQDSDNSVPSGSGNVVPRRRQWKHSTKEGPRIPSAGGQSYFSVATLDVDSIAAKNEDRMRRLDAILNAGGSGYQGTSTQAHSYRPREQDPETILHNFQRKAGIVSHSEMESRPSEKSLDCETGFQHIDSLHS